MLGCCPKCDSPSAELHSNGVYYGNDWRLRPRRKRKAA